MAPTVQTIICNAESSIPLPQPMIMNTVSSTSVEIAPIGDMAVLSSSDTDNSPVASAPAAPTSSNSLSKSSSKYTTPKRLKLNNTVTPSTLGESSPSCSNAICPEKSVIFSVTEGNAESCKAHVKLSSLSAQAGEDVGLSSISSQVESSMTKSILNTSMSPAPTINLGPRLKSLNKSSTPVKAMALMPRKTTSEEGDHDDAGNIVHTNSPVKPRNLESVLKKGNKGSSILDVTSTSFMSAVEKTPSCRGSLQGEELALNTNLPLPSQFLAAKISPLISSHVKRRAMSPPRNSTQSSTLETPSSKSSFPDITKAELLSPCGIFLSPRTPTLHDYTSTKDSKAVTTAAANSACLTPSNFACDFGKDLQGDGFDASGVFAWLHSPTAQGLFSPNGGLSTFSVTNTPRGMYGFPGGGKAPYTPSANIIPSTCVSHSANNPSFYFSDFEGSPKNLESTESERSMICISPLTSQKCEKFSDKQVSCTDPDTPMSIDFNKVFATPRIYASHSSKAFGSEGKKIEERCSPVLSAFERNLMEDEDLNAMLQLAETTTPGGRPIGFMSPLLTNSLRRAVNLGSKCHNQSDTEEPPSNLQLPIITSRLSGNGTKDNSCFSPLLTIRSTSAGSNSNSSKKRCRSKKVKQHDVEQSQAQEYHQHQRLSYPQPPHPSMLHYPSQNSLPTTVQRNGYYNHGQHAHQVHMHLHNVSYPQHINLTKNYSYDQDSVPKATSPKVNHSKNLMTKRQLSKAAKAVLKKSASEDDEYNPSRSLNKKTKKSSPKGSKKVKVKSEMPEDPEKRQRVASAIRAVNESSGGNENAAALAAAIMRGVTMRPSGKWQAQLYYSGKSRYIGVFDSREKAALAYEISREILKEEKGDGPLPQDTIDKNVNLARKAAFAGVNGVDPPNHKGIN